MRYLFLVLSIFLFLPTKIFAESFNPVLDKKDIIFEKSDTGYDLYIRKLKEINSILLTESQRFSDPKINNYALRTEIYYEANSDEIRIQLNELLYRPLGKKRSQSTHVKEVLEVLLKELENHV